MRRESRTKKSLLNARMNMLCYFLTLVVAFFTRKTLLDYLGTEFIGLTGTLQSLLGFLNLAELGVGSAIAYVLYKPLFDEDETKIDGIISVSENRELHFYTWHPVVSLLAMDIR